MRTMYLFIFAAFFLYACEPPEDDSVNDVSDDAPWERQFLYGNVVINGEDVLANELNTTNEMITDYICYDDFPTGNLETFLVSIYVPTHTNDTYQSGLIEKEWVIFFDDIVTEDIYASGSLLFNEKTVINQVTYSKFTMAGAYSGADPITRDNFQQMRIDFDLAYKDETGVVFYTDPRVVIINIDICN